MEEKQGNIKISSENMMPIIKKWLYSDKDIFLREIVANGVDAITKFKKLAEMGEAQAKPDEEYRINVYVDEKAKTLTVEDNGIGMTAEEVEKYITQIAFSGAEDFLQKYENASGDGIIGHFGLGFYSAYMVSDDVEIYTKSYKDEPAVKWESDGNSSYTIAETEKSTRGTKIVMHIAEGEEDFLKEYTIRELIRKYCSFMPYNIYLNPKQEDAASKKAEKKKKEEGEDKDKKEEVKDKPLNNTSPLYLKDPKECTDEEYKDFYRDTFMDYNEPLFWIHLNMDYPFRLKGILYFPKVKKQQVQLEKGQVKLYCNQVFIADNIKEVIPEFLMLLNGVIDCPDIPLNVSRSFLQNDKQVQKISKHITKKVADKLTALFNNERERYNECWKDIATFIKFGCLKDDDFYDKVKDIVIFKNLEGEYKPLNDFLGEEISDEDAGKGVQPKAVYYVSDEAQQAQYIKLFKDAGLDAIVCDTYIDPHFISYIEYKNPKKCRFVRIDADIDGALKSDEEVKADDHKELIELFKNNLINKDISVKAEKFKSDKLPAVINVEEFMRRMSEMNSFYGMSEADVMKNATLVLNLANPIVSGILEQPEEKRKFIVDQVYYLAMLSYKKLTPDELSDFVEKSTELLADYTK
ncbi:MAG: molecular chaperone HtpG [Firmicutes bacterium]|jgi:heat shock protein 90|nr:molecular chaperone HtpG [Bacillota bacterium]